MTRLWGPDPATTLGGSDTEDPADGVARTPPAGPADTGRDLAARQAELVAALVAGGPAPTGFDPARLDATRRALLRKRAGQAAKVWPLLAASLGSRWPAVFSAHRDGVEPVGALRDGWDVARELARREQLGPRAAVELAEREAALRYDGHAEPQARRGGRMRRAVGTWVIRR